MKLYTPDMNNGTNVFVFGSNESGIHAGGAAAAAHRYWGAVMGVGFGLTGSAFALPTMDWSIQALPLATIGHYVERFIAFARLNPDLKFLVTPIGTGICGYQESDIKPMFDQAPENCELPEGWR